MTHHIVKALTAGIASADGGGFRAIASMPALDRDGEVLAAGCFNPLPATVPVHLDHSMSAATTIGRGVPFYVGPDLHIDVALASTLDAQTVRTKLAEKVLDSISVVFMGQEWEQRQGVRTLVRGELLAADVVSVPSQSAARVLSVRGYSGGAAAERAEARRALADMKMALMRLDLQEAQRFIAELARPASHGAQVRDILRRRP